MKSTNNPIHFELQVKALFDIFLCYSIFFFLWINISLVQLMLFYASLLQRDADKLHVIVFCKFCVCVCGLPSVLNEVTTLWFGDWYVFCVLKPILWYISLHIMEVLCLL